MELNRKTVQRLMLLILFAAAVFCCVLHWDAVIQGIRVVLNVLSPFAIGGAMAFILNVPMNFIETKLFAGRKKKGWMRAVSLVMAILLVVSIILLVSLVVAPELVKSIRQLIPDVQQQLRELGEWADDYVRNNQDIQAFLLQMGQDGTNLLDELIRLIQNSAYNMISSTVSAASSVIGAVANFVFSLIFACYILAQKETLGRQVRSVIHAFLPHRAEIYLLRVFRLSARTFSSFITGQCLEACILGFMFFIVMTLLRFPYATLVGILIAFTALIPIFGAFIGCAISALLILMENPLQAVIFIGVFLLLQQLEGNLIYPRVVGNSVGLAPIWVFAAVLIGGDLFGVLGMLVFIPITSVVYTLFREWVKSRCARRDRMKS